MSNPELCLISLAGIGFLVELRFKAVRSIVAFPVGDHTEWQPLPPRCTPIRVSNLQPLPTGNDSRDHRSLSAAIAIGTEVGPKNFQKFHLTGILVRLRTFRAKCIAHIGTRQLTVIYIGSFLGRAGSNSVLLYSTRHAFTIVIGNKSEWSASMVTSRRNAI